MHFVPTIPKNRGFKPVKGGDITLKALMKRFFYQKIGIAPPPETA